MKYNEFKEAIKAAGFQTDYNRISLTNQDNVSILDILEAKGFGYQIEIMNGKKWVNRIRHDDDFFVSYRFPEEHKITGVSLYYKDRLKRT